MKSFVLVGGFMEGKKGLEPVAEVLGSADGSNVKDVSIFLFRDVMEDAGRLITASYRRHVIMHSAASMALNEYMRPFSVTVFNGPEPTTKRKLVGSAIIKSVHHIKDTVTGPDRMGHATAFGSNSAEFGTHPWSNMKHLNEISNFSTIERMAKFRDAINGTVQAVAMQDDEFFPVDENMRSLAVARNVPLYVMPGRHDDLLVRPAEVLMDF